MLQACLPMFRTSTTLFSQLKNSFSLVSSNWNAEGYILIKEVFNEMERANLINLISAYDGADQSTKVIKGNQICARTFRLQKKSLFSAILLLLKEFTASQTNTLNSADGVDDLAQGVSDNPFDTDVTVLNTGSNSLFSYDRTRDSVTPTPPGLTPMNLTLRFP